MPSTFPGAAFLRSCLAKSSPATLARRIAAYPGGRFATTVAGPFLLYVALGFAGAGIPGVPPAFSGWAAAAAATAAFYAARHLVDGRAASLALVFAFAASFVPLAVDVGTLVARLGFDAFGAPLVALLLTSRWPAFLGTTRDAAIVASGGGIPWWRGLEHFLAVAASGTLPTWAYVERDDYYRKRWRTPAPLWAILVGAAAASSVVELATDYGGVLRILAALAGGWCVARFSGPIAAGASALRTAVAGIPATVAAAARAASRADATGDPAREAARSTDDLVALAVGASSPQPAGAPPPSPPPASPAVTVPSADAPGQAHTATAFRHDPATAPAWAPHPGRSEGLSAMRREAGLARVPDFDESVDLAEVVAESPLDDPGDPFAELAIGSGPSAPAGDLSMIDRTRQRTQDEAVAIVKASMGRIGQHSNHALLRKVIDELVLLDVVHRDDVANASPVGHALVVAFETYGRDAVEDIMLALEQVEAPAPVPGAHRQPETPVRHDPFADPSDADGWSSHEPVAPAPPRRPEPPARTAFDDDRRPAAPAAPARAPDRMPDAPVRSGAVGGRDASPTSDLEFLSDVRAMHGDEIADVALPLEAMFARSIPMIGADLVRRLVACPFEGAESEKLGLFLQSLARSCEVGPLERRISFLYGLLAAAHGITESERDLAKRKLSLIAAAPYARAMDDEIESFLVSPRTARDGARGALDAYVAYATRVSDLYEPDEQGDGPLRSRERALRAAAVPRTAEQAVVETRAEEGEALRRGQTALIQSRLDEDTKADLAFFDRLGSFYSILSDRIASNPPVGGDFDDHPLAGMKDDAVAGGYDVVCGIAAREPTIRRGLAGMMARDEEVVDFVMHSTGRRDHPLFAAVCRAATTGVVPVAARVERDSARAAAVDARSEVEGLRAQVRDLSSAAAADDWATGVAGPADAVARRVASALANSRAGGRRDPFPTLVELGLGHDSSLRCFAYDWGARGSTRRLLIVPFTGQGQAWDLDTSARGVVLWSPSQPWLRLDVGGMVDALAPDLARHGVDDLKVLMLDSRFGHESSELLSNRLGERDTFDVREEGSMRPNPSRGIVVTREDLETGHPTLSARSGLSHLVAAARRSASVAA